jgi:hypothetical protein
MQWPFPAPAALSAGRGCGTSDWEGSRPTRKRRASHPPGAAQDRMAAMGSHSELIKSALTFDEVRRYDPPTDFTKATDTRRAAFVAHWGDLSVELDALRLDVLRNRIATEIGES